MARYATIGLPILIAGFLLGHNATRVCVLAGTAVAALAMLPYDRPRAREGEVRGLMVAALAAPSAWAFLLGNAIAAVLAGTAAVIAVVVWRQERIRRAWTARRISPYVMAPATPPASAGSSATSAPPSSSRPRASR